MATKFDGTTKDGIHYTILRGKNGKPRNAQKIAEFQVYLAEGRSLNTARCYMTTLNQIISDAVDKGALSADPRKGVQKIKTEWLKKKIPFTPEEIKALEDAATGRIRRLAK